MGAYADQYEKIQLFNFNGAIADKSVIVTSKGAFFLNTDGIYQYDGVNCSIVSEKINKTMGTLDKANLKFSKATDYNNKYILTAYKGFSYDGEVHEYLTIEFDYENGTFTKHSYGMKAFINIIRKLYGFKGKFIYSYQEGEVMPFHWKSGDYTLGAPNAIKECENVYVVGSGDEIDVTFETEKKPKTKKIRLNGKTGVASKPLINFGRMFSELQTHVKS